MPRAVRFDQYGGLEVLKVVEVERPIPGPGKVLVRVKAAGINPGEASIRKGLFAERWPSTFPSGQGSDLAGVVEEVGPGVTNVAVGDEVIGFTNERSSQAELVVVEAGNLVPRPANVSWEQAGALFVAGTTAYAAVRSVALDAGDTVVVSGAAGGVGSLAVQLARNVDARVIGLAGSANHKCSPSTASFLLPMVMVLRNGSGLHAEERSMHSLTPSAADTSSWRSSWA
jgi:NADPH:quinone reductase-like Zn-dependent oxidoreductase